MFSQTSVILFKWVCVADTPPWADTPPGRHLPGQTLPPPNGYCCGWYTSYWNAFLFHTRLSVYSGRVYVAGGHVWQGGACVAGGHEWQEGHAWWQGARAWQGGMNGRRGMHGGRGCAWWEACLVGGVCGRGHAWQERWPLQQMVRILLECILVLKFHPAK